MRGDRPVGLGPLWLEQRAWRSLETHLSADYAAMSDTVEVRTMLRTFQASLGGSRCWDP